MYKGQNKKLSIRRCKARHPIGQGPRLRPSANESEGRMKHTEGETHSEERAALPFKGTRTREPRSRMARQQYRSLPTTWKKDLPQEEWQRNRRHREIIQPKQKRLGEPLNDGVKEHPTPLICILETKSVALSRGRPPQ